MKRLKRWYIRVVAMNNLMLCMTAFLVSNIGIAQSDSSVSFNASKNPSHLPTHLGLGGTKLTPAYPFPSGAGIKHEISAKRRAKKHPSKANRKSKSSKRKIEKFLQVPESLLSSSSLMRYFRNFKMSDLLKSIGLDTDHWKGSESARLFLAPVMAAVPVMFAEVLAIGGMGLMGPAMLFLPLFMILLLPLAFVAFILFI